MFIVRAFGIESHVLTPAESKELYPLLDADNFYASLYSPQDGNIDPNGFCTALARGATNAGAKGGQQFSNVIQG